MAEVISVRWHHFALRVPVELWPLIRDAAKENGRSVNAEIVYRLRQSLTGYRR
jgi:hypothetical protein